MLKKLMFLKALIFLILAVFLCDLQGIGWGGLGELGTPRFKRIKKL